MGARSPTGSSSSWTSSRLPLRREPLFERNDVYRPALRGLGAVLLTLTSAALEEFHGLRWLSVSRGAALFCASHKLDSGPRGRQRVIVWRLLVGGTREPRPPQPPKLRECRHPRTASPCGSAHCALQMTPVCHRCVRKCCSSENRAQRTRYQKRESEVTPVLRSEQRIAAGAPRRTTQSLD
jgi:hypothetical protein